LCDENWLESLRLITSNSIIRKDMIEKGMDYYNRNCTREILQIKWLAVIESVLTE